MSPWKRLLVKFHLTFSIFQDTKKGVGEWLDKMLADRHNCYNAPPDMSPLHMAIYKQHPHVARMLIEKGADVNLKDQFGLTPFMYCALRSRLICTTN